MKRYTKPIRAALRIIAWAVLLCLPAQCIAEEITVGGRTLTFDRLEFETPEVRTFTTANGMKIYFLEDRELPVVEVSALIRVGDVLEPPGKSSLASMTGALMRTGGTSDMSPEEVNERLENLGAVAETSIGTWSGSAYLWSLREDFETVLDILAAILRKPGFDEERIDIRKERLVEAIRRRNDVPARQAALLFPGLLYGREHPLGSLLDSLEIRAISRSDLITFHREYIEPADIWIGVAGDISFEEAVRAVESRFGDWEQGTENELMAPLPHGALPGTIHLIPRDIEQATVIMGHLGPLVTDPDYLPLVLGNRIFGGGGVGVSRLWKEVRSDRGLAYSVGSSFSFGTAAPGSFRISLQTKMGSVGEAVGVVRTELERLLEEGVSSDELDRSKKYYMNSYPFDFSRPISIVGQTMSNEYRGLPDHFLSTYPDLISRITVDEVNAALRRHVHPDSMVTVVVGRREELEPALVPYGDITIVDEGTYSAGDLSP